MNFSLRAHAGARHRGTRTLLLQTRALAAVLSVVAASGECALAQAAQLDHDAQMAVIAQINELLAQRYVFPEIAAKCAEPLRSSVAAANESPVNAEQFAERLTETLRSVSDDQHLLVRVRAKIEAKPEAGASEKAEQVPHPMHEQMRRLRRDRERNFGFEKIERLEGNIGYLDLRYFAAPWLAQPTAEAAMTMLAHADALVFDLRQNQGGMPGMVQFLCSYLFVERTHLNSLWFREGDQLQEFWTHEVPGTRLPDVPVFVLTSAATFSAAEEFCYNLRTRERATLVGETTRGGANPGGLFAIDERFEMVIPTGRAINPVTGTNWDGVGVTPHVAVPAAEALAAALALARPAAEVHRTTKQARVARIEAAHREALRLDDDRQSDQQSPAAAKLLTEALHEAHEAALLDEEQVNMLGYELLGQGRHALALAAFASNVEAYPESANAHDSLGEARKAAGDTVGAIASYERALALDPDGPNSAAARAVLRELKQ